MFDFTPATQEAARLLDGVHPEHLDRPSPCEKWSVADLLDHLLGLSAAFTAGAQKQQLPAPEVTGGLPAQWREELPRRLDALTVAWADPAAWRGLTNVGGVDLPGEVCARVALDEVMVHSWDLAVATGQEIRVDPGLATTLFEFWSAQEEERDDLPLRQVIFGPAVAVPGQAPVFARVLGLTGRDPHWRYQGADQSV